jgi:hypothetical protein
VGRDLDDRLRRGYKDWWKDEMGHCREMVGLVVGDEKVGQWADCEDQNRSMYCYQYRSQMCAVRLTVLSIRKAVDQAVAW